MYKETGVTGGDAYTEMLVVGAASESLEICDPTMPGLRGRKSAQNVDKSDWCAHTEDQVEIAREAWRRYGKGRHVAGLNFGGCFSYALAKSTGEPLLFKGDDFAQTDIAAVAY